MSVCRAACQVTCRAAIWLQGTHYGSQTKCSNHEANASRQPHPRHRRSKGKIASLIANLPLLLITTYGRKTGKPATTPVVYLQDGGDYLVSATNGGSDWDPGWFLNLKARPQARIEIGEQAFDVQAVVAASEERRLLYERFKAASANFIKYEKGTWRVLPVIRLSVTR